MKHLGDASVDAIVTDPPYKYLKNQKLEVDFCEASFFEQAKRVLKPNGFIVMFGRGISFYRWNLALHDLGFKFLEEVIWDKSRPSSGLLPLLRVHESISIFTKKSGVIRSVKNDYCEQREYDFDKVIADVNRIKSALNNPTELDNLIKFIETKKATYEGKAKNRHNIMGTTKVAHRSVATILPIINGLTEKSIITEPKDAHYTSVHPTQKPIKLMERLIRLVSDDGAVILDPFMGSGSTGVACANINRQFIGYELDAEYFGYAKTRISEAETRRAGVLEFPQNPDADVLNVGNCLPCYYSNCSAFPND